MYRFGTHFSITLKPSTVVQFHITGIFGFKSKPRD